MVQLKPYFTATGGGCNQGTDNWQVGDSASLSACISGYGDLFTWHVNPDGYASFSTQVPLAWTDCTVTFKLIDQTNGNRVVESLQQSCLSDAQHNHTGVHYVVGQYGQGICPLRFQTLGELQGHYGGTTIDFTVSSPTKFINC